jgi:YihY family inner membrane protein
MGKGDEEVSMCTASAVPETYELEGDDAREMLKRAGWPKLLKDSFTRFRTADGFSHVRALAHATVLTAFPALITIIGLATVFDLTTFRNVLEHTLQQLAPGPSGRLLTTAFRQGSKAGGQAALVAGLLAALVSGTFALAQVERGCNRIYGIVRDRRFVAKLRVAFLLALSAGLLLAIAFMLLAAGDALGEGLKRGQGLGDTAATVFAILRWPAGLLLTFAALTVVYKMSPNRRQPGAAWLQTGTIMATLWWFVLTALLAIYYSVNDSLGTTYGPLIGVIAILTWAYTTALALYFGIAFAAQLEALRAGVPGPRTLRRFNEIVRDPRETADAEAAIPAISPPLRSRVEPAPSS